jgi:hypothetical protein
MYQKLGLLSAAEPYLRHWAIGVRSSVGGRYRPLPQWWEFVDSLLARPAAHVAGYKLSGDDRPNLGAADRRSEPGL